MGSTDKVVVRVDPRLLSRAEALRQRTGETRSALFARALRKLLAEDEDHQRRVEQYVAGYRQLPESAADVTAARLLASRSLAALPWDDS